MASQYVDIVLYCLLIVLLSFITYYIYTTKISSNHRNNFVDTEKDVKNTMPDNIIDYINAAKNIGDIKTVNLNTAYLTEDEQNAMTNCKNITDDDDKVKQIDISKLQSLFPYNSAKYSTSSNISCRSLYNDYLLNNMDFDDKILKIIDGENKSLTELCPVTVKTPEYMNCLDTVDNILKKTNSIVSDVGNNVDNNVNRHIDNSFNRIADLENDLLVTQMQKKFQDYLLYSGDNSMILSNTPDKVLSDINKYYSTKSIEGFSNIDDEIQKNITIMDKEQAKYFNGSFTITDSLNLLKNITIEIKNNIIIFYNENTPLFYYEYDNVKNVGVLNNNMSVSNVSAGELQAVKVRITSLVENNSGNNMENFEILKLLNNIGFTAPGFIYLVRTDINVVDGNKTKNKEYYLVKNSGYATMFQMFRITK